MKLPEILEADSAQDIDQEKEAPAPEPEQAEMPHFYFIAAVKVVYIREGKLKERTVNVLMDLIVPYINQNTMNDINRAACGRVMGENKVNGEDIREAVIMSISLLGQMTPTEFRQTPIESLVTDDIPN